MDNLYTVSLSDSEIRALIFALSMCNNYLLGKAGDSLKSRNFSMCDWYHEQVDNNFKLSEKLDALRD